MIDVLIWFVGAILGLFVAIALATILVAVVGPLLEWLVESTWDKCFQRPARDALLKTCGKDPIKGARAIIVSDLHIDTWDYNSRRNQKEFLAFVHRVRQEPTVTDFIINGDINDLPPHPLNQKDPTVLDIDADCFDTRYPRTTREGIPCLPGVWQPQYDDVLRGIASIGGDRPAGKPITITYLSGNHDITMAGFRYVQSAQPYTGISASWTPSVTYKVVKGNWLYMEHGHRFDPLLWLYLRYATLDLSRDPTLNKEFQRRSKLGMDNDARKPSVKGVVDIAQGITDEDLLLPPKGLPLLAFYRFRQMARLQLWRMRFFSKGKVRTLTCGHTHITDRYEYPGGLTYINSGDWAGNSPHQSYLVVREDGVVTGPHQWRTAPTE